MLFHANDKAEDTYQFTYADLENSCSFAILYVLRFALPFGEKWDSLKFQGFYEAFKKLICSLLDILMHYRSLCNRFWINNKMKY